MATIHDVAKLAGVGSGTASRALNLSGPVSEEALAKVQAAAEKLGYRPSSAARALSRRQQGLIGVLIPQFDGNVFGSVLHLAEQEIRRAGKHLMVASAQGRDGEPGQDAEALAFLDERDCDGLLLLGSALSDRELILLAERQPALAIFNRHLPELSEHCFALDHAAAGRAVAQQLLAEGHRDFAAITGPKLSADAMARQRGYASALAAAGHRLHPDLVVSGNDAFTGGVASAQQLLATDLPFSACFCGNDEMAISANYVFQAAGRQVAIFGYDNTAALQVSGLKISSVAIPVAEMVQSACAFLLNLCYGSSLEIQRRFEHRLVLRPNR